ncbi:MAG: hypothetical protein GC151_10580 [Betaproteobacteria bacterium]|nr:hypothetical protein [Betaproteobacteria bacterium]
MSTTSIGSSTQVFALSQARATSAAPATRSRDRDGDGDGGGPGRSGRAGGGFAQTVLQALSQIGVNVAPPPGGTAAGGGTDADGDSDGTRAGAGGPGSAAGKAVHALVHDLFQALRVSGGTPQTPSGGNPVTATGSSAAYQDLATRLQNLVQQLSNGSTSGSGNTAVDRLQGDFQKVLDVLGSPAQGTTSSLQGFLGNLLATVQNGAGADTTLQNPLGAVVTTRA